MRSALLGWALSTVLGPAAAAGSPADTACAAGQRLEIGESCSLRVAANQSEVALPITLVVGDRYRLSLLGGHRWNDWGRPEVDPADGDPGNLVMKLFAWLKRLPREPYMVMGMVSRTDAGGSATTARLDRPVQWVEIDTPKNIAFFANDVPGFNRNNRGEVWLTVERQTLPDRPSRP